MTELLLTVKSKSVCLHLFYSVMQYSMLAFSLPAAKYYLHSLGLFSLTNRFLNCFENYTFCLRTWKTVSLLTLFPRYVTDGIVGGCEKMLHFLLRFCFQAKSRVISDPESTRVEFQSHGLIFFSTALVLFIRLTFFSRKTLKFVFFSHFSPWFLLPNYGVGAWLS